MALIKEGPKVPTLRRFQKGSIGSRYKATSVSVGKARSTAAKSTKPRTPAVTKPKVPQPYDVQSVQTVAPPKAAERPLVSNDSMILRSLGVGYIGFNAASALRIQNEALAAEYGLRAVYNAPQIGEAGVSGWGGPFGEIFTRSGRNAARMSVAYLDEAEYAAARAAAIAEETARGQSVVSEAYQYVKTNPSKFIDFGSASRNLLAGIAEAASSLTAFQLIPGLTVENVLNNFLPEEYRGLYGGSGEAPSA